MNYVAAFRRDGVVRIRSALDAAELALANTAYQWSLDNPGPHAAPVLGGISGAFYQDHANPHAFPMYRALLQETRLAATVAGVLGSANLWLLYEQIWMKEGAAKRRTPWHQDLAYVPMEGDHLAVAWLTLDPVEQGESLEFVTGSHGGPLYNPTAFDARDPAAAMFEPGVWPPLPDIEANRSRWPISSWAVTPGDIIVFHPGILHGGAPTRDGVRRRTLSLRFFGDHAYCAARPESGVAEIDRLQRDAGNGDPMTAMARAAPGTLFRHEGFRQIY
jgi:ectoine hydroxylase-related dioxygenase (phytanoyl-CoA dioxygenase family)